MAQIKIPTNSRKALLALVRLKEQQVDALLSAISTADPKLSREQFSKGISSNLSAIDADTAQSIIRELFNLEYLRESDSKRTRAMVVGLVSEAIREEPSAEVPFTDDERRLLEQRLEKLTLGTSSLGLTAKAINVMTDQDRVFIKARVLTDFRPVFSEAVNSINAGVIVHTLTIRFSQDGGHKDFYVALDNSDIKSLQLVLDRAVKKTDVLGSMIDRAGVTQLQPEGDV